MAFNNPGYMTRGFQTDIPIETQMMIYNCLDKARQTFDEVDYLQVFALDKFLSNGTILQRIIHSQEIPTLYSNSLSHTPRGSNHLYKSICH